MMRFIQFKRKSKNSDSHTDSRRNMMLTHHYNTNINKHYPPFYFAKIYKSIIENNSTKENSLLVKEHFFSLVGDDPDPRMISHYSDEMFQMIGLSIQKIQIIKGISKYYLSGKRLPAGVDKKSNLELKNIIGY